MNFLKQKQKQIMLTLVGRGAKYSGVMYLSPTLEIMFETEPRSLLDADVDDVEICSRIVMWSRFEEFKQNRNYSQTLILMPFTLFFGLWDRSIRIWDRKTSQCINVLNGHTDGVYGLVVVQNEYLISISLDKSIIVWHI